MSKDRKTLKEVRRALGRRLTRRDDSGGFIYYKVFGCESDVKHLYPNIQVRAELRVDDGNSDMFRFYVFVDFHLPLGAEMEDAENFLKVTRSAVRRGRSVSRVVKGQKWTRQEVMELL